MMLNLVVAARRLLAATHWHAVPESISPPPLPALYPFYDLSLLLFRNGPFIDESL